MMTVCVQDLHFSAGHRILGLVGPAAKCGNLHGHTFTVAATWEQRERMGVEFTTAKTTLRNYLAKVLDHGFIVCQEDDILLAFLRDQKLKHYVTPTWPTTEVIAYEIAQALQEFLPNTRLLTVEVQEGPQNMATWCYDHAISVDELLEARASNDATHSA